VLEGAAVAHQGTVNLDTVKEPSPTIPGVRHDLIKGTRVGGSTRGDNMYPAPTLRVDPGEKLIVHYDNASGPDDQGLHDPAMTPKGGECPSTRRRSTRRRSTCTPTPARQSVRQRRQRDAVDPAAWATPIARLPRNSPTAVLVHAHRHTMTASRPIRLGGTARIGRPTATCTRHAEPHSGARHGDSVQLRVRPKWKGHQLNNYSWVNG